MRELRPLASYLQDTPDRRLQKTIDVFDVLAMAGYTGTAQAFVHELQTCLDAVPEAYRSQVKFEIVADSVNATLDLCTAYYRRPETDAEMAERKAKAAERKRIWADERRAADQAEYLRLKAIFEPGEPDTVAQL